MPPIPLRVTRIKSNVGQHPDPLLTITHFSWVDGDGETGMITRDRMHEYLSDGGKAYIRSDDNEIVFLIPAMHDNIKIVATEYKGKVYEDVLWKCMAASLSQQD
jgi:hypothetical protein